nr:MAG TPA: hypothetical protein [Caudoviricetes sp.]
MPQPAERWAASNTNTDKCWGTMQNFSKKSLESH